VKKPPSEEDLHDELRSHIEIETSLNIERGLTPEAARTAARRAFGNAGLTIEATRAVWRTRGLDRLQQDARYAIRALSNTPGFTAVAVVTMALGIGVNTALFTIINAAVFRSTPVRDAQTLNETNGPLEAGEFAWLRRNPPASCEVAASAWILPSLQGGELLHGYEASDNYFSAFDVQPGIGRLFSRDDYGLNGGTAIVLSHDFWRRKFTGDPAVVGRTLKLDGGTHTIVGVAEKGFIGSMPLLPDFWTMLPERLEGRKWLRVSVRLRSGASAGQAAAELSALRRRYLECGAIEREFTPVTLVSRATLVPLNTATGGLISLLMACVGFVLLIACSNVANLLLARAAGRQREIAVRASLGASRSRVLQQLLTESLLLAFIGGALGLVLAALALPVASATIQSRIPKLWGQWSLHLVPDVRVFLYTGATCVTAALLFGLVPALRATAHDLTSKVKEGSGAGAQWSRSRLRGGLVVVQVALCVVLLIGAGLLARSVANAYTADPGFDAHRTAVIQIDDRGDNADPTLHARILERLPAVPGIESAAAGARVPLLSSGRATARSNKDSPLPIAFNHVTSVISTRSESG
jgi:predicted permease